MVWFPKGVPAVEVRVNVEVFGFASGKLSDVGLKPAVTPDGRLPALRFTVPVNPARGVTVTVYCAGEPGVIVRDDGVAFSEKSGVAEIGDEITNVL